MKPLAEIGARTDASDIAKIVTEAEIILFGLVRALSRRLENSESTSVTADRPRCNSSPRRCCRRCRRSPAPDTGRRSGPLGTDRRWLENHTVLAPRSQPIRWRSGKAPRSRSRLSLVNQPRPFFTLGVGAFDPALAWA